MALANALDAATAGYQSQTSAGVWNGRTFQGAGGVTLVNADGTAGNTTINGGAGSPTVNSVLDGFDDFIYNNSQVSNLGDTNWLLSSGAVTDTSPTNVAGHPGIISSKTSGSMGLYKGFSSTGPGSIILGAGIFTATFYFRINSLTTYSISFGLADAPLIGSDPVNGVYIQGGNAINSGNWVSKTSNASTRTTGNSSTPVATGWLVGQVVVNAAASSVSYYIGTTLAGLAQLANSPISTNIPSSAALGLAWGVANGGSGSVDLDLVTWNYALTTAR